jgi:hypothetical protein
VSSLLQVHLMAMEMGARAGASARPPVPLQPVPLKAAGFFNSGCQCVVSKTPTAKNNSSHIRPGVLNFEAD